MAIESALVLAKHLKGATDVKAALRAYEAERQPRTARTTANSWKFGKVFQWQNGFAVWLRARLLRSSFSTKQAIKTVSTMLQWNPPSL
jgi:2-polyprenyl-6-methoxyphenol hydroxylase-like FAD-dependent oxidoreductase